MNKQNTATILFYSLIFPALAGSPVSAENADVNVAGQVVPGGCRIDFDEEGGVIDVGEWNSDNLSPDELTWTSDYYRQLTIHCDGPTKVALTTSSARGASAVNDDGTLSEIALVYPDNKHDRPSGAYGLGMAGNSGIGGFTMKMPVARIDEERTHEMLLTSDGSLNAWQYDEIPYINSLLKPGTKRYVSWGAGGSQNTNPVAFTHLDGVFVINVYFNKATALDLSKTIRIDGMAAIDMIYL